VLLCYILFCSHSFTIPTNLELSGVAPLLCAGITTFSPYKDHGLDKAGLKIGVVSIWCCYLCETEIGVHAGVAAVCWHHHPSPCVGHGLDKAGLKIGVVSTAPNVGLLLVVV
jgi:D-arabinose 1-dehydrogenase-like Zn-dependent alcohol dehydrogenase